MLSVNEKSRGDLWRGKLAETTWWRNLEPRTGTHAALCDTRQCSSISLLYFTDCTLHESIVCWKDVGISLYDYGSSFKVPQLSSWDYTPKPWETLASAANKHVVLSLYTGFSLEALMNPLQPGSHWSTSFSRWSSLRCFWSLSFVPHGEASQ